MQGASVGVPYATSDKSELLEVMSTAGSYGPPNPP